MLYRRGLRLMAVVVLSCFWIPTTSCQREKPKEELALPQPSAKPNLGGNKGPSGSQPVSDDNNTPSVGSPNYTPQTTATPGPTLTPRPTTPNSNTIGGSSSNTFGGSSNTGFDSNRNNFGNSFSGSGFNNSGSGFNNGGGNGFSNSNNTLSGNNRNNANNTNVVLRGDQVRQVINSWDGLTDRADRIRLVDTEGSQLPTPTPTAGLTPYPTASATPTATPTPTPTPTGEG